METRVCLKHFMKYCLLNFFHPFLQCFRTCHEGIIYDGAVSKGSLENELISGFFKYLYSLWVLYTLYGTNIRIRVN